MSIVSNLQLAVNFRNNIYNKLIPASYIYAQQIGLYRNLVNNSLNNKNGYNEGIEITSNYYTSLIDEKGTHLHDYTTLHFDAFRQIINNSNDDFFVCFSYKFDESTNTLHKIFSNITFLNFKDIYDGSSTNTNGRRLQIVNGSTTTDLAVVGWDDGTRRWRWTTLAICLYYYTSGGIRHLKVMIDGDVKYDAALNSFNFNISTASFATTNLTTGVGNSNLILKDLVFGIGNPFDETTNYFNEFKNLSQDSSDGKTGIVPEENLNIITPYSSHKFLYENNPSIGVDGVSKNELDTGVNRTLLLNKYPKFLGVDGSEIVPSTDSYPEAIICDLLTPFINGGDCNLAQKYSSDGSIEDFPIIEDCSYTIFLKFLKGPAVTTSNPKIGFLQKRINAEFGEPVTSYGSDLAEINTANTENVISISIKSFKISINGITPYYYESLFLTKKNINGIISYSTSDVAIASDYHGSESYNISYNINLIIKDFISEYTNKTGLTLTDIKCYKGFDYSDSNDTIILNNLKENQNENQYIITEFSSNLPARKISYARSNEFYSLFSNESITMSYTAIDKLKNMLGLSTTITTPTIPLREYIRCFYVANKNCYKFSTEGVIFIEKLIINDNWLLSETTINQLKTYLGLSTTTGTLTAIPADYTSKIYKNLDTGGENLVIGYSSNAKILIPKIHIYDIYNLSDSVIASLKSQLGIT